mmetsp:Transcript_59719/g.73140  ORF Transcript_59719/g.73140 Transcript_59719/m.73140 type:complete len:153 (+) Transcript_59719:67-525(+)
MMKVFHISFCISLAFGSLDLPIDEMDIMNAALLEDDHCEGDCSVKLLQIKGAVEEEEVCLEWKECPGNSEYYLGQKCNEQHLVCQSFGKPQKRQCLKWVNCKNSCYCAQWAKLLEESAETDVKSDRGLGVPEPEPESPEEIVQVEVPTKTDS